MLEPQVVADWTKSEAFAPVIVIPENINGMPLLLVIVTVFAALVLPIP